MRKGGECQLIAQHARTHTHADARQKVTERGSRDRVLCTNARSEGSYRPMRITARLISRQATNSLLPREPDSRSRLGMGNKDSLRIKLTRLWKVRYPHKYYKVKLANAITIAKAQSTCLKNQDHRKRDEWGELPSSPEMIIVEQRLPCSSAVLSSVSQRIRTSGEWGASTWQRCDCRLPSALPIPPHAVDVVERRGRSEMQNHNTCSSVGLDPATLMSSYIGKR